MPKYIVDVRETMTREAQIEISADSALEAEKLINYPYLYINQRWKEAPKEIKVLNVAKKIKFLTPEQQEAYVNGGYCKCPYCKSEDIEGKHMDVDGNLAWQPVVCNNCDTEWRDIYTLTGIHTRTTNPI